MKIRTRIAPSPTGDPHVGTAYVALINQAFTRSQGGEFVLRVEDTDQERSTAASEQAIFDALGWAGIQWDEGPDVGGEFGPYRQSERRETYARYAQQLIEAGHAFVCFCSRERLDDVRRQQQANGETPRYDGHCLGLSSAEVTERVAAGEPHVIRMKVPEVGVCRFSDGLRGDVEIPWQQVDMQVLLKTDGFPTYHLAVVVDDHLMEISHVLRGEEWINSMPKHVLLYQHFGWDMPAHYHLPLLRNPDKSKMSKRKNPTSINYYRDVGFLPEALLNYLAMMGWSMPDEREIFSFDEMVAQFDLDRVTPRGPVFDMEKLRWLNGQYLRALSPDDFRERTLEWLLGDDRFARLVPMIQERTERLSDVIPQVHYLLGDRGDLLAEDFAPTRGSTEGNLRILHHALVCLEETDDWTSEAIYGRLRALADAMEIKIRDFLAPLFIAISGQTTSLPLFDSMVFLGRDVTRVRVRSAIDALGGIGKKATKRLEREYRELTG